MSDNKGGRNRVLFWLYAVSVFVLAFSGFGQMPLYKRYGISEIPGMAFSADFYFTHMLHYLFAALILGLAGYALGDWAFGGKRGARLTCSGWLRAILLMGIFITGAFRAVKNLNGVTFSPEFTLGIDVAHLGLAMFFLVTLAVAAVLRSPWLEKDPAPGGQEERA